MKFLRLFCLCASVVAGFRLPLHAESSADYHIGDIARADIYTPVELNVENAAATAALRETRAREIPAIFRNLPAATNTLTHNFLATFARAHSNFVAELTGEYHAPTVNETMIASADFGRLITAFGVANKDFPVSDELAAEWARGHSGDTICNNLLTALWQAAGKHLRPDVLPRNVYIGDTIRLVAVTNPSQALSPDAVRQSPVVPAGSILTVSNVQMAFRRAFPAGQQLFARALARFIQPNCELDVRLTKTVRADAVRQLVVSEHFNAGDLIVRRGEKIDGKAEAALRALDEKFKANPSLVQPPPVAAQTTPSANAASLNQASLSTEASAGDSARHTGLIAILAAVSVAAVLVAIWQFVRRNKQSAPRVTIIPPQHTAKDPATSKPAAPPQVEQVVRDAVMQELAVQRRTLIVAQQSASAEINNLVQRLDDLHLPLQQRLQTYEIRLATLEQQLAARTEENRELLEMKIEMIRLRMETERAATQAASKTE